MDTNRYLILNELIDAYKSRDDSKTKKILEELSSKNEIQWSVTESTMIHYISYMTTGASGPLTDTARSMITSIEEIQKVSIGYIKRKSTSTPYSMC